MPLNKYFTLHGQNGSNENERSLIESLHQEAINIHGYVVKYIPRVGKKLDLMFGEDVLSRFETSHDVPVWLESYEGFGGQSSPALISKLGIELRDELHFKISSKEFREVVQAQFPNEGDLIYLPLTKELFEIKWVEHRDQFFPLAQQMSFRVRCEPFEFSNETFETGTDADNVLKQTIPDDILDMEPMQTDNKVVSDTSLPNIDFSENSPFGDRK